MVRRTIAAVLCALSVPYALMPAGAQDAGARDPLQGSYTLGESAEILLLWSNEDGSGDRFQGVYDYRNLNNPDPNVENELVARSPQTVSSDGTPADESALDVITGDFDGDALDDYVAVWEGPDRSIEMIIPSLDREAMQWTTANRVTVAGPGAMFAEPERSRVLRLARGDFDDDPAFEFLLAYWGSEGALRIELYETDAGHAPVQRSAFGDPQIRYLDASEPTMTRRSTRWFDVNAGDFDGDGTDEIVAVGGRKLDCAFNQGCWTVFARVYDVHPETYALVQRADTTIFTKENNSSEFMERVAVEPGRYGPEFADRLATVFEQTTNNNDTRWYLNLSRVLLAGGAGGTPLAPALWGSAADTSRFEFGPDGTDQIHATMGQRGFALSPRAVDFHQDGVDELALYHRRLEIYEIGEAFTPTRVNTGLAGSGPAEYARHALAVADLDADNDLSNNSSDWLPELVVVENEEVSENGGIDVDGILRIRVISWDPALGFNSRLAATIADHRNESSGARPVALGALDVGDDGVRVGRPQRYARTDVVRPLVILNAPPTHYDVFDGQPFDVSACYGENDCACQAARARCFQAEYTTETERSITLETELTTDWSTAVTAGGGFEIPVIEVGVDASITATYGEGFRRTGRSTETFTVRQSVQATRDDWIYAMIVNYDIWEYPLFAGGSQVGHIGVVVPKLQTRAWFDSKSWNAFDYVPFHEVGNILSYRSIAEPEENTLLAESIRWNTGDQITLSGTSDVTWQLTSEGETETQVENRVSMGLEGSVDFDIPFPFIPDIGVEGSYENQTVDTRTVKVRDMQGLTVAFGNVDQGIGNTRYDVIPYVYWAKNGALVLDYAVNPELARPGFEGTWWQRRYGEKPDPAFILPWRYDREKGSDVSVAQTRQTQDILFDPPEPDVGDVVTIKARVQNWSLLPTPGPVEVRFFVGDPAGGGVPIVGVNGEASVLAPQMADRGSAVVEMDWRVPSGIGLFPRIYAVIDPAGTVDEIHETNNTGWTVLNVASFSTDAVADAPEEGPTAAALFQNYPNPFRGGTTIAFDLPRPGRVTIRVLDLLGREVDRIVDREMRAGSYNVRYDASGLPSGVYVYRLTAGGTVQARSMTLVR